MVPRMRFIRGVLWLAIPLVCCLLTLGFLMQRQDVVQFADAYTKEVAMVLKGGLSSKPFVPSGTAAPDTSLRTQKTAPVAEPGVIKTDGPVGKKPEVPQEQQPAQQHSSPPPAHKAAWQLNPGAELYKENQREHPVILPGVKVVQGNKPEDHCKLAKGNWCGSYWTQPLVEPKPPPRNKKECPANCNGLGWCDYDTGRCFCRAGYEGPACDKPKKRPCNRMDPVTKRDQNYTDASTGWIHTRCAGLCDDDIGMCHCPPETKFGRKAPIGKPVNGRFEAGRPMFWCQPNTTADGKPAKWTWNIHKYEDVLGPEGWCNDNKSRQPCACHLDGMVGPWCDEPVEMTCMNQCSGHGECILGFCMCHEGWYSHDCSRRKAGLEYTEGEHIRQKPWLQPVTRDPPSAADPQRRPFRKRPFIYVYDLDPAYNFHMMQYRLDRNIGVNRLFNQRNHSDWIHYNAYAIETVFHELMLTSEHRTFDPEEADFFYVPIHVSSLADIVGKASKPFWPTDLDGTGQWGNRPYQMSMMLVEAKRWLARTYPYWNRTMGRDHIFLLSHDEAPCYVMKEMWDSIILSHWGRMDFPHGSNSSYGADDYSRDHVHHSVPGSWKLATSGAHPCHDPDKHLIVPVFKQPPHYQQSVYLGGDVVERDILAFFRGDMGLRRDGCKYSRCIRQTLYKLSKEHAWREKHNIWYGEYPDTPGDYTRLLSRSKFCLVIPGDGWSARYEDSTLHGCIPVIIMDNTLGPFESLIDYSKFAIRIAEHELAKLPEILLSISPAQLKTMQEALADAWMRFRWNGLPLAERDVREIMSRHRQEKDGKLPHVKGMEWAQTADDDAFSTVIQWLHSKIDNIKAIRAAGTSTRLLKERVRRDGLPL